MSALSKHPFVIRWRHWEYWPMSVSVIPTVIIWFIHAMRAMDLAFFSAVNPALHAGGLFDCSKEEINAHIPPEYLPKSVYLEPGNTSIDLSSIVQGHKLDFPLILKPDKGERGFNIDVVRNQSELEQAYQRSKIKVILQEYIDYDLEYSVLCYINPETKEAGVSSVCIKKYLGVSGDGKRSIRELMQQEERAILQIERLQQILDLDRIPTQGERVVLEQVGNHRRGTKFINASHLITARLIQSYTNILQAMPGISIGRFDLKARTEEEFLDADHIRILEFNGANSEPIHMYDPKVGMFRAYGILWHHWSLMRRIAMANKRLGSKTMPVGQAWSGMMNYLKYKNKHKTAWT